MRPSTVALVKSPLEKDPVRSYVLPKYERGQKQIGSSSSIGSWLAKNIPLLGGRLNAEGHDSGRLSRAKNITVLGVHGWFPTKLIQRCNYALTLVVGGPTGTSVRLCQKMTESLAAYCGEMSGESQPRITAIPLEGEGKIMDRVAIHYKQLTDSSENSSLLRESDFVFVVAHSQGAPVSLFLIDRLLNEGLIKSESQTIVCLTMAGVHHGPFSHLKSSLVVQYIEADPARELFELNDPLSEISKIYTDMLNRILNQSKVRILCVAGWMDQVVPVFSATMHGVRHHHVHRAMFIDGPDYSPDFFLHLLVFVLKVRNHGLSDHGLAIHLSEYLMGSLYQGDGHSRLYENDSVYRLAFQVAESACMEPVTTLFQKLSLGFQAGPNSEVIEPIDASIKRNPYFLPWILHKILTDTDLSAVPELKADIHELLRLFSEWRPSGKVLKELKYRLEPLSTSKL